MGRRKGKTQITLGRSDVTACVTKASIGYMVKRGFSCFREIKAGRGSGRLDVLAINLRSTIIGIEVKSSLADLKADDKFHKYREFTNQLYLAVPFHVYEAHGEYIRERAKAARAGVLVLQATGYCRVALPCRWASMDGKAKRNLVVRAMWRAGEFSPRNTFRTKVFLT